jgi:hypothetical protein
MATSSRWNDLSRLRTLEEDDGATHERHVHEEGGIEIG